MSLSSRARAGLLATGMVGAGLAVGVVVTQLGIASADTPTPSPSYAGDGVPGGHFGKPGGPMFDGGPGLWPGRVLHGQATVETPDGTDVVSLQEGTITSLGGSTITVRSSDGFVRTYTVDADTRITHDGSDGALSTLTRDDDVHVMAERDGDDWHARAVLDGLPKQHTVERWREFHDAPEPSASPSAGA